MEKILLLLQVIRETRDYPKLKAIHDDAMGQLEKIAEEPKKDDWEKKAMATPHYEPPKAEPHRRVAEA